ncbi:MAG TPA: thioredoxin domain-containing protein [Candidatus Binataceae bacterium]|nr:thioredoxin domain-containing protein [Candidatus Binataceae bacterium]
MVPALLLMVVLTMLPRRAFAQASPAAPVPLPATATPPPNALPPNPAIDARVTAYIQKRFMIDDPSHIQLGPVVPTDMSGVYSRSLRISNDKGQFVTALIYTNAKEEQMILSQAGAQLYDMTKDPWEKVDAKSMHLDDRPVMGPASAPVTIVEFADFECPFCARAFGTLETMVHSTYKDKLRVIYKNYPLNSHPWAVRAAVGAECARLQNPNTFWDFARDYYSSQGSITVQNIDDHIHATAKRLNLDVPTLDACMAGKAAKARIDEDQKDGNTVGVASTPTLVVNGIKIVGLPSEKAFNWVVSQQINPTGKEMLRQ